jgi:hypothetical protein
MFQDLRYGILTYPLITKWVCRGTSETMARSTRSILWLRKIPIIVVIVPRRLRSRLEAREGSKTP